MKKVKKVKEEIKIEKVKISEIKTNPSNPRIIKDHKFKKLVKSIQDFPEMLEIRPIVVDENMIVLGGNMRLKACKDAGLSEVYIIRTTQLTDTQKKDFILKDNNSFGEWNLEELSNFDKDMLLDAGFEDWNINAIFGNNEMEDKFKGNIEGSNFNPEVVNVDDYIKQNIFFFNELMLEFEDDFIKEKIKNIENKELFLEDIKKVISQHGKDRI